MTIQLLDLLSPSQPILYTAIFSYLDPPDIIRLLATCRSLQLFKSELWNINRSLRRFVDDPIMFRTLMARHNALVSGSHALQFLARVKWPDSDLDVYITGEDALLDFSQHLTQNEGYSFSPYTWQSRDPTTAIPQRAAEGEKFVRDKFENPNSDPIDDTSSEAALYSASEIDGVFNFVHNTSPNRKIQLISARATPLNAILADYYATHIFNMFTWNRSYSFFPYHTFGKKHAFYTHMLKGSAQKGVEKYTGRGFEFKRYGNFHKCVKNCPFRPHRRVGDKYCWVIDLDTYGVDGSDTPVPQDVLETSTWGMKMHYSWWSKDANKRMFKAGPFMDIQYSLWYSEPQYGEPSGFRHPRIIDNHSTSWVEFIQTMKKTTGGLSQYLIKFAESKPKDWKEPGEFWMDNEFASWYRFWETSLMPYDNIWRWQYPMLDGGSEITVGGMLQDEEVQTDLKWVADQFDSLDVELAL
ncbi:hypothetical protein TWF730_004520 [Orbilia blumenaviensis]|uniref:F-box domain-containing protein n=1 Tax=Orbilia blumenaviensis TaxID=1796055 RepID=A0AAV9TYB2_9PEZI